MAQPSLAKVHQGFASSCLLICNAGVKWYAYQERGSNRRKSCHMRTGVPIFLFLFRIRNTCCFTFQPHVISYKHENLLGSRYQEGRDKCRSQIPRTPRNRHHHLSQTPQHRPHGRGDSPSRAVLRMRQPLCVIRSEKAPQPRRRRGPRAE